MSARAHPSLPARASVAASSRRASSRRRVAVAFGTPFDAFDPSAVVARLAERALMTPFVLKRYDDVRVTIDADFARAMTRGELGSAAVRGRGWSSPRDLTCREIELVVRDVTVDLNAAMSMRGVVVKRPARGRARLTFDGRDFGNFLTHPLVRRAARDETFEFERGTVARGTGDDDAGRLEYSVVMKDGSGRRAVAMRPGERSTVRVRASDGDVSLERALQTFFERLVVDLDGTELRYRDMTIDARAPTPTVAFELDLCVKKFPSPGLDF